MLEDRQYMRSNPFRTGWLSMTSILIMTNIVAYIVQLLIAGIWPTVERNLALSVSGVAQGYLWQFLTFQFMHGSWLHLLFNCFAIFMFGRDVEESVGRKSFLTLYLSSGALGGLLQVLFSKTLALLLHNSAFESLKVVGASAGAFGLIAAFVTLSPNKPIMFIFIPVTFPAKFLLLFEGVFALLGMATTGRQLSLGGSQVAHAAHLGGMLTGILFIRYALQWQWPQFRRNKGRRVQKLVPSQITGWGQKKRKTPEEVPAEEFFSKEVDPILDKISAHGIQSLTERERHILQAAGQKMGKR